MNGDITGYLSAGPSADIEPGKPKLIRTDDDVIAIHNLDGEYFAISNVCPHAGAPLSQGFIENGRLTCPWHGWSFPLSPIDAPRDGMLRYRVVVEGPPNWTSFREFWRMFAEEGAVVVASSYTKVGGVYDQGFRHDPDKPLESLAEYCLGCYTNRNLPQRVDLLSQYVEDYQADGVLINSIKSCNSFSAGQLLMMREIENRTGKPGAFIETDLVDPRYFSAANVKNRLESYFQMIEQRRKAAA